MATKRRRRVNRRELTVRQEWELLLGPGGSGSAFPDDEARRAAWALHREEILGDLDAAQVPWAARQYDE